MSTNNAISIKNVTVAYDGEPVVWNASVGVEKGKMTAIVGPNGAGKSTLLKALLNTVDLVEGDVDFYIDDDNNGISFKNARQNIAYVPQKNNVDWDFPATVLDVVLMGFYGKLGLFNRPSKKQKEIALEMLGKVKMEDFKDRQISQLSGGQRQRVFIARALCQDAEIYIMDEPLAGVDIQTEKIIMHLLRNMVENNQTVVVVHHDLSTIEEYFDNIIFLNHSIVESGSVSQVYNQENIERTYQNVGSPTGEVGSDV